MDQSKKKRSLAEKLAPISIFSIAGYNNHSLSLSFTFVFWICIIGFITTYLTFQIPACQKTVNRVNVYNENSDCYCENDITLPIWANIISETDFCKQFDILKPFPVTSSITNLSFTGTNNSYVKLIVKTFQPFYQNYLQYLFGNRITEYTFDLFSFDDPLEIAIPVPASHPLFNNTCGIEIDGKMSYYKTGSECLETIMIYKKNFISGFDISYDLVREYCHLSHCEEIFCPSDQILLMITVIISFSLAFYIFIRLIHNFVANQIKKSIITKRISERKLKQDIEKNKLVERKRATKPIEAHRLLQLNGET